MRSIFDRYGHSSANLEFVRISRIPVGLWSQCGFWRRRRREGVYFVKRLERILEALERAREHIDGEIDVVDGDYSHPAPNKAMQLATTLDAAIAEVKKMET